MKTRTTLYLEKEIVETAKKIGLNLSRICEMALEEAIKRMKGSNSQNEPKNSPNNLNLVGRVGLEPTTFCASGRCPNHARRPAPSNLKEGFPHIKFQFDPYFRISLGKVLNSFSHHVGCWAGKSAWDDRSVGMAYFGFLRMRFVRLMS